jgi:hypothetical protein
MMMADDSDVFGECHLLLVEAGHRVDAVGSRVVSGRATRMTGGAVAHSPERPVLIGEMAWP